MYILYSSGKRVSCERWNLRGPLSVIPRCWHWHEVTNRSIRKNKCSAGQSLVVGSVECREKRERIEVARVVCGRGGDWRDEMQVKLKHDAKTMQEPRPRAATEVLLPSYSVKQSTARYRSVKDDILLLESDMIIQHNTIRVQFYIVPHTPFPARPRELNCPFLTPAPGPGSRINE